MLVLFLLQLVLLFLVFSQLFQLVIIKNAVLKNFLEIIVLIIEPIDFNMAFQLFAPTRTGGIFK